MKPNIIFKIMISNISSTYFDKLVVCFLLYHVLYPTSTVTLVTPLSFFFISLLTLLVSLYLLLCLHVCLCCFLPQCEGFLLCSRPQNFEVCYSATTFRRHWHSFLLNCRSLFDVKNFFFFFPCALQSFFFLSKNFNDASKDANRNKKFPLFITIFPMMLKNICSVHSESN